MLCPFYVLANDLQSFPSLFFPTPPPPARPLPSLSQQRKKEKIENRKLQIHCYTFRSLNYLLGLFLTEINFKNRKVVFKQFTVIEIVHIFMSMKGMGHVV